MNSQSRKYLKWNLVVLASFLLHAAPAHGQSFVWAKRMGGNAASRGQAFGVAVDGSGNVYTGGGFRGTVDFDPGAGTFNLTSAGSLFDIFVSKLDSNGNFVWAKRMGGGSGDQATGVAVDGSGNIYTTGRFFGTADFDPGVGTFNLTGAGGQDIFVSKFDSAGNFVWAKQMGGGSGDFAVAVAVDGSGNVYTTGFFFGTADFDPGAPTFNLTSAGGRDIFVSKLDSAGNFVWAKRMGGVSFDEAVGVAVDGSGNVYTTGPFFGTADFDPGAGTFNLTPAGFQDIFVSKLDSAGNFVWAKRMGGVSSGNSIVGVAVDGSGDVYTAGSFFGTVDFDPGAGTFNVTAAGGRIFVSKLDSAGNFVWAKQMGGVTGDQAMAVAVNGSGNVYTTGLFAGTADFDPGAGTFNLAAAGGQDIFVSKLDSAGNFVWAKQMGGVSGDFALAVAVDGSGNVYTTGWFFGTADFDPGAGTFNLTATGVSDIFVSKLGPRPDSDGDGVLDGDDLCPGTTIPESVPSVDLHRNRWALLNGDFDFDTTAPKGIGPDRAYTTTDTGGCSCEQIIVEFNLGKGHTKYGCSTSRMDQWVGFVAAW